MKKIIVFLSLCTLVLSSQVVHADAENVTPQNAIAEVVANSSGQPSVEQENSYSTTLENVTEENESGSAQLNSTSSTVASSSSSIDLQVEEEVRSISEEADSSNNASTSNLSDLSAGTSTSSVSDQSTDTSTSSVSDQSTDISTSNLSESSTDEISTSSFTASSTEASIPNPSTRASTKSVISSVTETSSTTSSTQVGTSLRSMPRTTSLSGNLSISNVNAQSGSFDVHVTNVSAPRSLSKVLVPTWTESNGQDDIIYHTADRQSDGSYKVTVPNSKHKYGTGKYHIHLYYRGTDGSMTYVAQTTTTLPELKTSGNVSVSNVNAQSGSFDVHVTNVSAPRGLSKVLVPTWTESNGQDDIIYHTADRQSDGSYKVTVPNSKHKYGTGKYHIHLYYRGTDGSMTYVAQTTTTLPELKTSGNVSVSNVNAQSGSFDVHVTNVSAPRGLSKVLVPTWTESNGQDDIIYHTADRQSDGSYKVTVPKSKHKYGTGKYHIHLYYRGTDGSMTYVAQTTTNLPQSSAKGTISAELVDATKGTFSVSVSNIVGAEPIKDVEVAVWSEKNYQDDLKSYSANRKSDGTYHVEVAKGLHRNDTGTYHIEVYYRYANTRDLIGSTTVDVPSTRSYTVYIDPGHGGRDSGASYGGIHEKNLAMSVSNKLRDNLLARGINVLMTRTGDTDVDFRTERSRMANESNADLFVSIHFNATGIGVQSTVKGIETYWYQYDPEYQPKINQDKHNDPTRLAESEILAVKVQSNLIKETGATDRGVRRETFAVLRETAIPAILVELGFMDNPSELAVIKEEKYHVKLAKALTQGIMDWYGAVGGK
ncbi:GBS Bsp-like repeat-containing protein [Streptococcus iners]|uniref:GBS Bsp-like repeat-containing protein n=1 Tax=Streptococcus iners TaxID=3028084 RepID=UPI0020036F4C